MVSDSELFANLYNQLKGISKVKQGELTIEGFEESDYSNLFEELIQILFDEFEGNYEFWYNKWARSYYTKFLRDRNKTSYCPQVEKPLDIQTEREQLVILKFFLYRRTYSRYSRKGLKGVND